MSKDVPPFYTIMEYFSTSFKLKLEIIEISKKLLLRLENSFEIKFSSFVARLSFYSENFVAKS